MAYDNKIERQDSKTYLTSESFAEIETSSLFQK